MIKSTSIQDHLAIYAQKDAGQRGGLGRRAPNWMRTAAASARIRPVLHLRAFRKAARFDLK